MSAKTRRMSFSLPVQVQRDLDYLSQRMGITKSALLAELMAQPISDLRSLVESVPPKPTQDDVLRASGRSTEIINKRLEAVRKSQRSLF